MRANIRDMKHLVSFFLGKFFYGEVFMSDYEVACFYSQQIFKADFRCFTAKINQPEFYLVFIVNFFNLSGSGEAHNIKLKNTKQKPEFNALSKTSMDRMLGQVFL